MTTIEAKVERRTFRVWRDNEEEWPAEGEPEGFEEYEASRVQEAAASYADEHFDEGDGCDPKLIVLDVELAMYFQVKLRLSWDVDRSVPLDINTIREPKP